MDNETEFFSGALIDTRPEEAKVKDRSIAEAIAYAAPIQWFEKKANEWRKFLDQNQNGSGSCVMQTIRKLCGILFFINEGRYVEASAGFYQYRSNKPGGGMIGVEAFDIWKNEGVPLECLVESDLMTDAQMDSLVIAPYKKDIAKFLRIGGHLGFASGDFDTVASTIQQTKKGVMVWFYFHSDEWSQKFPQAKRPIDLYAPNTLRHSVAAVDFGLIDGKQYIKIEDSAHFGRITESWISREFFVTRNYFARYSMNFKFEDRSETVDYKPVHNFTEPLEFIPLDERGNISDPEKSQAQKSDVTALQDILRFEGYFPTNFTSTGYYGAMTAKALYNWQVKHAVAPLSELDSIKPIKGARVGSKTIAALNSLYK